MLSKNKIKFIHSLGAKKNRDSLNLFCAEGEKCVEDLFSKFQCQTLIAKKDWIDKKQLTAKEIVYIDSADELKPISAHKTPQPVFAVFEKTEQKLIINDLLSQLSLVLDEIQDPGNLGTIIRIADWFGIRNVICSKNTTDVFNPKALQATMGAAARVHVHYVDLVDFLKTIHKKNPDFPIYGTLLSGKNIYETSLQKNGLIVMGNEGNGICKEVENLVSQQLLIPNFPQGEKTSESLNVSVATAIVCAEFRRRMLK